MSLNVIVLVIYINPNQQIFDLMNLLTFIRAELNQLINEQWHGSMSCTMMENIFLTTLTKHI